MMVLGIDYSYDDKDQPYSKGARSDTIMAAGVDFPTKREARVSVLRDTEALYNGKDTKINQAYSDGGVKLADRVIGDFLGMPTTAQGAISTATSWSRSTRSRTSSTRSAGSTCRSPRRWTTTTPGATCTSTSSRAWCT